jgi:hypothetical protein
MADSGSCPALNNLNWMISNRVDEYVGFINDAIADVKDNGWTVLKIKGYLDVPDSSYSLYCCECSDNKPRWVMVSFLRGKSISFGDCTGGNCLAAKALLGDSSVAKSTKQRKDRWKGY